MRQKSYQHPAKAEIFRERPVLYGEPINLSDERKNRFTFAAVKPQLLNNKFRIFFDHLAISNILDGDITLTQIN